MSLIRAAMRARVNLALFAALVVAFNVADALGVLWDWMHAFVLGGLFSLALLELLLWWDRRKKRTTNTDQEDA